MAYKEHGFTLTELLLSIAIIGMLVGLSLPVYNSFLARNDLDIAAQGVADMLRRAQTYARGVSQDSQWSVHIQSGSAILFKGSNFASRDTSYDEPITIPVDTTVSGLSEVVFTKLSAAPNQTGTITLTTSTNDTRTITINAKGMVSH